MRLPIQKPCTMVTVALDTNVIVALVDDRDTWRATALAIRDTLIETQAQLLYFDCVFNETIGIIGRRTEEQKRPEQFDRLLDGLTAMMPPSNITWVGGAGQQWLDEIIRLCRESHGTLNFHDALMALACQNLDVRFLVSFDTDFDCIPWLTRLYDTAQIATLTRNHTPGESV
jgi:predicted nucleic acid-binding protein